jgi:four helix bundle protein
VDLSILITSGEARINSERACECRIHSARAFGLYQLKIDYPMKEFSFEKLSAWKRAKALLLTIYDFTQDFPSEERFVLTQQIRRAMLGVTNNLAEGSHRASRKDQAHFSTMAFSSLMEVLNLLIISYDLGYLDQNTFRMVRRDIQETGYLINGLRKSQTRS